jgi:NADH dehydrogenase FAD-containing subunit
MIKMKKTIILAGSGHAHLEIIKYFSPQEISEHEFILISPYRQTYYSGLIPRLIAGQIETSDLTINSADFAEKKGFQFIQDSVVSVNQVENTVQLMGGKSIHFDILSMNIGGTPLLIDSEPSSYPTYLRPFDRFLPDWQQFQKNGFTKPNPAFIVVGGGAAAVEVASALRIRLEQNNQAGAIHLVSNGSRLCQSYSEEISTAIQQSLINCGIQVHLNEAVNHISENFIILSTGERKYFDSIFVVTPTAPSKIIHQKINSCLQISSCIFSAGDGTAMSDYPHLPRSGVMAVHQGQHIAQSLRRILSNQIPLHFQMKNSHLNILITGKNKARLVWGNFSIEGYLPLFLKNWIDQRYVQTFTSDKTSHRLYKKGE